MADDQTAFRDFKSQPTADSLIRLLRAHQERVYRLCLQVLRRAHDAEDAAQEVLIRIVDGVRKVDDADAFRRWVYRVSLNAALEAARKASRRRTHESRAAMEVPPGQTLNEESRRSLFEAIARLDEGPRSLVLDHYFEGETLESLGSREGVSAQAVSKRLDRAREELKRALPASFLGVPDLGRLFEWGAAPSVAPDLVSGPVLAKVHSIAVALAVGGVVVASKISIVAAVVITALLCLTAGTGLGVLLKS
ncbi:MAG TPA: sigma-70 family RNA polymerase sigma factor, partial [Planctomycetota bacterium]|nr:sigma-70 family RNA polymerase sigma factor [Planctomycetota bacterium]